MVVNELLGASSGVQPCNPRGRKEEEWELSSAVFEASLGWICEVLEIDVCGEERGFREEVTLLSFGGRIGVLNVKDSLHRALNMKAYNSCLEMRLENRSRNLCFIL